MWSVLEHVPSALEKDAYSPSFSYIVCNNSRYSVVSFRVSVALLIFVPNICSLMCVLFFLEFCHFYYNMSWCRSTCASYIWISVSCFRFQKFPAIISLNTFAILSSLSFLSEIPIRHRLAFFILSHRLLMLLSYFFLICVSVCSLDCVISIILSSISLIHSSALLILLFVVFSSALVSSHEFFNFSWLFLMVSNSFL